MQVFQACRVRSRFVPIIEVVLAVSLSLTCTQGLDSQRHKMPSGTQEMSQRSIHLSTKIEHQSEQLLVFTYSVENSRSTAIYVFNLLYRSDSQGYRTLDPELAYADLDPDGVLIIGKYLIAIPPGMKVESPEMPYLDRVEPGATLWGKIRISIPVEKFHPYLSSQGNAPARRVGLVHLRIGFLDSRRFAPKDAVVSPGEGVGVNHYIADYGLGLQYQEFLTCPLNVGGIQAVISSHAKKLP